MKTFEKQAIYFLFSCLVLMVMSQGVMASDRHPETTMRTANGQISWSETRKGVETDLERGNVSAALELATESCKWFDRDVDSLLLKAHVEQVMGKIDESFDDACEAEDKSNRFGYKLGIEHSEAFLRKLKADNPNLKARKCAGYATIDPASLVAKLKSLENLPKPFEVKSVSSVVGLELKPLLIHSTYSHYESTTVHDNSIFRVRLTNTSNGMQNLILEIATDQCCARLEEFQQMAPKIKKAGQDKNVIMYNEKFPWGSARFSFGLYGYRCLERVVFAVSHKSK